MTQKDFTTPLPDIAVGEKLHGFAVERVEQVPEISGCAYIMRHEKSGARLMWLACADDDKSFGIGFKTPPADDTGVFHINEHSVLCGSRKFPVKEPFVNLLKTSMQTFLNAMTFPDKTVYPVSSTNEQDLLNLMDVYLDAVLHPAIYQRKRIFEQEGWHYEVGADGALTRNGVVYNEMKGALSDPDDMLVMLMNRELFPDTAYGYESGGDPKAIPTLSYEAFLDANARHYRLSNSYTVLYGDLNIHRMLAFVGDYFDDEEDRGAGEPNLLHMQEPVVSPGVTRQMSTAPENAAVGLGYVFATAYDRTRVLAASVLLDAIMGNNEAPLKRAILQANLGNDAHVYVMDGQLQPYVFLELKGAKPGAADQLERVVNETCEGLVRDGIDRDKLESALAQAEFALREGDRGVSDGVIYTILAMSGWLYDDSLATTYLRYEDALSQLHEMLDDGGFERLLDEIILQNGHRARVTLEAAEDTDASEEAAQLAGLAAELGEEGVAALRAEAEALHAEQEAPDAPEALATLPQLHVSDIGAARVHPQPVDDAAAPLPCIAHELDTHGIDYLYGYFGLDGVGWDELPYVSLLARLLGRLGTREHDASSLITTIERELGTLHFSWEHAEAFGGGKPFMALTVAASSLSSKVASLAALPREVWSQTVFDDRERIRSVLGQLRLGLEQSMATDGHTWAMARVASYTSPTALAAQQMGGVDFYRFLCGILDDFDGRYDGLVRKLEDLSARIFAADRLTLSFTGPADDRARFWDVAGDLGLARRGEPQRLVFPQPAVRSEAFVVPANVCFAAQAVEGGKRVPRVSGPWLVASRLLSFDYLWNEVRVKGGAYGCGFSCTTNGRLQFYSYRDPAIDPTLERFAGCGEWLSCWDPSVDELEGYIVSSVAKRDAPVKPRALARRQDMQRFTGVTEEFRTTLRDEILACTPQEVRELGDVLRELQPASATCIFGGKDQIAASTAGFEAIEL